MGAAATQEGGLHVVNCGARTAAQTKPNPITKPAAAAPITGALIGRRQAKMRITMAHRITTSPTGDTASSVSSP